MLNQYRTKPLTRIFVLFASLFLFACTTTPDGASDTAAGSGPGEAGGQRTAGDNGDTGEDAGPGAAETQTAASAADNTPDTSDAIDADAPKGEAEGQAASSASSGAAASTMAEAIAGDLTPLLEASHFFASTASRYRQAATLARDPEYITLLTSLAEERQALANETSQAVIYYEADDLADNAGKPTAAYIGTAAQAGGEALGEALIESETALIDRLRRYLADDAVSVDAKTYFQAILPDLRSDRERVADLSGIELETAEPPADDEPDRDGSDGGDAEDDLSPQATDRSAASVI